MKSLKIVAALGVELSILFFALALIFYNLDAFHGAGDAIFMVFYFFTAIFLIDSVFYLVFRLLIDLKRKTFFRNTLIIVLSIILLGIAVFATTTSTGRSERIGILFLFPFALLGLRYLFLKFLAHKK